MDALLSDTIDSVNLWDYALPNQFGTAAFGSGGTTLVDLLTFNPFNHVEVGDLVVNAAASPNVATITKIVSPNQIKLSNDISVTAGVPYIVYSRSTGPATLYVGTVGAGATLKVKTAGGDDIVLDNLVQGTTIPLQVVRVYNTGTANVSNIVALF
jgi:hypothetical protein